MTGLVWYCLGLLTPFLVLAGCVGWEAWCQARDGRFAPAEHIAPDPALPRHRHRRTAEGT